MCGIVGFFSKNFSKVDLVNMTNSLKHRGPDAEGHYVNSYTGIGLGHRQFDIPSFLRIILLDESKRSSKKDLSEGLVWEEVVSQEAWIDDASPEDISLLSIQLRKAGALEVTTQPIQMKKGSKRDYSIQL